MYKYKIMHSKNYIYIIAICIIKYALSYNHISGGHISS